MTSIEIPNSVTEIGSDAFHGCTSLTSIVIPASALWIGKGAFDYCSNLETIEFLGPKTGFILPNQNVDDLDDPIDFSELEKLKKIYVPAKWGRWYLFRMTLKWSHFRDVLFEKDLIEERHSVKKVKNRV